jgi:hypothetical protein
LPWAFTQLHIAAGFAWLWTELKACSSACGPLPDPLKSWGLPQTQDGKHAAAPQATEAVAVIFEILDVTEASSGTAEVAPLGPADWS